MIIIRLRFKMAMAILDTAYKAITPFPPAGRTATPLPSSFRRLLRLPAIHIRTPTTTCMVVCLSSFFANAAQKRKSSFMPSWGTRCATTALSAEAFFRQIKKRKEGIG